MENTELAVSESTSPQKQISSAGLLLRHAFFARKAKDPHKFSMRVIAKQVGVSRSYLSLVFRSQKQPSPQLVRKLVKILNMGGLEKYAEANKEFTDAVLSLKRKPAKKTKAHFVNYYDSSTFSLNDEWYYIALLDLTTCSNFQSNPLWIAKRLGISVDEALVAIEKLQKAGLLKMDDGILRKLNEHVTIPTISSREKIRKYHKVMSAKAIEVMEKNISATDFQKRLIKGTTFAVNPDQLEQAKEIINKALVEVIETLTAGDCTELYHFNLQLFPLLQPGDDK